MIHFEIKMSENEMKKVQVHWDITLSAPSRALEYAIAISYDCHCCSIVVIKKSFIYFITISNHSGKS
jgi:hypothetical protein